MRTFYGPSGQEYFHNGDYSGDVVVSGTEATIPFEDIRALYLEFSRRQRIAQLEQATPDQLEKLIWETP